jgi:Cys-rich repeat protein
MEQHSFDELAKGLAEQTMTRGRALKLAGASLLGAVGLVGLPSAAVAKKKKKKHHHRAPSPTPSVCSAGDVGACNSCGTSPTSGHICNCAADVPTGLPVCYDTQSTGPVNCTNDGDCPAGERCLNLEGPCGGTGTQCLRPCS